MPRKAKTEPQGGLFAVELDDVWEQFISTTNWDKVDVAAEKAELTTRAKDLTTHIDTLTSKLEQVREQLSGLDDRAKRARDHLEGAAKTMGRFATPAVLLASLREAFPPSKVKAPTAPAQLRAGAVQMNPDIERALLDNLDTEGVTATDILKALRAGGWPHADSDTLAKYTKQLERAGKIECHGAGRSKTYRLVNNA
jgi:outer membrane murein-binding lipoprotein Lpp